MIFICYVVFVIWGLIVFIGYLVVGIRMWCNLKFLFGEMFFNWVLDWDVRWFKRLFVLMCLVFWFGVIKFFLLLYMVIGEYGVFVDIGYVKSWFWFVV